MSGWTDVKAVLVSAATSTKCVSGRCRIRGFSVAHYATTVLAAINIKDGTTSTVLIPLEVMGPSTSYHLLPGAGVLFPNGVSVVTPTSVTMTVYYDGVT